MSDDFKPGDLVRHKTGGPVMCVFQYDEYGVRCEYWQSYPDGGGNWMEHSFTAACLAHHVPEDDVPIDEPEMGDIVFPPLDRGGAVAEVQLTDADGAVVTRARVGGGRGLDPDKECRHCGLALREHGDQWMCPTGDSRFHAKP